MSVSTPPIGAIKSGQLLIFQSKTTDKLLSITLCWLLRHAGIKEGLKIKSDGFVAVDEILSHKSLNGGTFTRTGIERVVKNDDKQRFCLRATEGCLEIRANHGHTLTVVKNLDLPQITSDFEGLIVHGTFLANLKSIEQIGLSRLRRNHIHFASKWPNESAIGGIPEKYDVFIFIDFKAALSDGLKFLASSNGVILSPGNEQGIIEPKYFAKIQKMSKNHFCKFCNVNCGNLSNITSHIQGKKHKNNTPRTLFIRGFPPNIDQTIVEDFLKTYGTYMDLKFGLNNTEIYISYQECKAIFEVAHANLNFFGLTLDVSWKNVENETHLYSNKLMDVLKQKTKFNDQIMLLEQHLQPNPDYLMQKYRMIFNGLQSILETVYPKCTVHLFGSVILGLNTTISDVDLFVELYDTNYQLTFKDEKVQLRRINSLLIKSKMFHDVILIGKARVPIISCTHFGTNLKCDINIKNKLCIQNTRLLSYYISRNFKLKKIMFALKYWTSCNQTKTNNGAKKYLFPNLTTYALCILFIFYLQQTFNFPSVEALQKVCPKFLQNGWNCSFAPDIFFKSEQLINVSLFNLFRGFFKFYANFDFSEYVICPFIGKTLKRIDFLSTDKLPNSYLNYKKMVKSDTALKVTTAIVVQDPFEHNRNITCNLRYLHFAQFYSACHIMESVCGETESFPIIIEKVSEKMLTNFFIKMKTDFKHFETKLSNTESKGKQIAGLWFNEVREQFEKILKEFALCSINVKKQENDQVFYEIEAIHDIFSSRFTAQVPENLTRLEKQIEISKMVKLKMDKKFSCSLKFSLCLKCMETPTVNVEVFSTVPDTNNRRNREKSFIDNTFDFILQFLSDDIYTIILQKDGINDATVLVEDSVLDTSAGDDVVCIEPSIEVIDICDDDDDLIQPGTSKEVEETRPTIIATENKEFYKVGFVSPSELKENRKGNSSTSPRLVSKSAVKKLVQNETVEAENTGQAGSENVDGSQEIAGNVKVSPGNSQGKAIGGRVGRSRKQRRKEKKIKQINDLIEKEKLARETTANIENIIEIIDNDTIEEGNKVDNSNGNQEINEMNESCGASQQCDETSRQCNSDPEQNETIYRNLMNEIIESKRIPVVVLTKDNLIAARRKRNRAGPKRRRNLAKNQETDRNLVNVNPTIFQIDKKTTNTDSNLEHCSVAVTETCKTDSVENVEAMSESRKMQLDEVKLVEDEEDVPADFFDDFSNQDFMAGLDIVDAWDEDEKNNTTSERKSTNKENDKPSRSTSKTSRTTKHGSKSPKRRRLRSPLEVRRRRSNSVHKRRKSPDFVVSRRDPEKTRRDINRDKQQKEQKIVSDKLKIVETGLVPPGTEMDCDLDSISKLTKIPTVQPVVEKRSSPVVFSERRQSRERRHRRSSSKERRRYSRSPQYHHRTRREERPVERRKRRSSSFNLDDSLSDRWPRKQKRRSRSRDLSPHGRSKMRHKTDSSKDSNLQQSIQNRKSFLEEIRDKLNEVHRPIQSSLDYHHMYSNPPVPIPVPAPNTFIPLQSNGLQQYDQQFFIGESYSSLPATSANVAVNNQMHTFPIIPSPVAVTESFVNPPAPVFSEAIPLQINRERRETPIKQTVDVSNIDKLFADKKISLSDFLSITAKPEVHSSGPEHLQKKIHVISRCQDAIKVLSEEKKFSGRLHVIQSSMASRLKTLEVKQQHQSPLRKIPVVRFQFTTPLKQNDYSDPFTSSLDRVLKKIGVVKETNLNDSVENVKPIMDSSFADENVAPIQSSPVKQTSTNSVKTATEKLVTCDECKKRKSLIFTDVGTQCIDTNLTFSVSTQVCEDDLNQAKGKKESMALLTPAQLLGKEKAKEDDKTTPTKDMDRRMEDKSRPPILQRPALLPKPSPPPVRSKKAAPPPPPLLSRREGRGRGGPIGGFEDARSRPLLGNYRDSRPLIYDNRMYQSENMDYRNQAIADIRDMRFYPVDNMDMVPSRIYPDGGAPPIAARLGPRVDDNNDALDEYNSQFRNPNFNNRFWF